ncbi:alcohol dehydrogenase zinc-binding domain-containing protein [Lentilactobacillus otakiensis DSM 19908 = JCM 15040]|uniref:Alcohol dehydrogenase zinc-binding domain-containing protein n=1 Tax=Lentilactobacillus otakiensis DSM 19908 = JCM 15040 TaxID=1423780 RepID=S4NTQ3_9LACO|nr:NADP-dependent oxidoreductase [Lentilactobacillus otakiensis]KRL11022.1 alcohol dehydrogenase zinc-binding domain-containing protein [Lentilactobacillus otakiensis DSM 19908 = JCM 15040]MBZ3777257.1 NADP-dependent oxidoreductase [Lentilactobacillus otakiensis]MDV3517990.1 NADP-dependent oxidoreductase [Lentilactobacillus otakiensis]GAD17363.1 alcohol dehydrogenase zinc-binding domain-containing protein [Lentilactobacillus otakiensis DSM 19908 = JCM 15040]
MKAFGYDHNGAADVFEEYDVPTPEISDDQILIKTKAFNLNNFEKSMRAGEYKETTHQVIPGRDVAGTVAKLGANVTGFKVGDRVVAHGHGAYAEYAYAAAARTVIIPDEVSFAEAAGLVTPGITAYKAVYHFGEVKAGQTIVVRGASGGVGSLAAQLSLNLGATVIGIGSSKNEAYVKSLGVQEYVSYNKQDPALVLANRADVVINSALNGAGGDGDARIVKENGIITTVGGDEPLSNKPFQFKPIMPTKAISDAEALTALLKLMAGKKLSIRIGYQLPFTVEGVIQGHELLSKKHDGRIIVTTEADK